LQCSKKAALPVNNYLLQSTLGQFENTFDWCRIQLNKCPDKQT